MTVTGPLGHKLREISARRPTMIERHYVTWRAVSTFGGTRIFLKGMARIRRSDCGSAFGPEQDTLGAQTLHQLRSECDHLVGFGMT